MPKTSSGLYSAGSINLMYNLKLENYEAKNLL